MTPISRYAYLTAGMLLLASCSWSSSQQRVLDDFNRAAAVMERGDWEGAMDVVSSSTEALLDSLSEDFTGRGLYGYGSGGDVLRMMYQEYIDFNGEVTMIFVEGDDAEITISPDDPVKYQMVYERGAWRLDLSGVFRERIRGALGGSYIIR